MNVTDGLPIADFQLPIGDRDEDQDTGTTEANHELRVSNREIVPGASKLRRGSYRRASTPTFGDFCCSELSCRMQGTVSRLISFPSWASSKKKPTRWCSGWSSWSRRGWCGESE